MTGTTVKRLTAGLRDRAIGWWHDSGGADAAYGLVRRAPPRVRHGIQSLGLRLKVGLGVTLVPEDEYARVLRSALLQLTSRRPAAELGDYLEFGVYVGTSLSVAHRITSELGMNHVRLIGFDSFEGLPSTVADEDDGVWKPGSFASGLAFTRAYLADRGVDWSRVVLVPGWFDETLTDETRRQLSLERVSVVMVDCDAYSSTKTVLPFFMPLVHDEAIVVFDDWHAGGLAERKLGQRRAFEEFLAEHPQFHAEELDLHYGENPKVFLVSRTVT